MTELIEQKVNRQAVGLVLAVIETKVKQLRVPHAGQERIMGSRQKRDYKGR